MAEGEAIHSCSKFVERGFYLTPAVKCPSEADGKDHLPVAAAIAHCRPFLRAERQHAMPERVVALGEVPFKSLCRLFSVTAPRKVRDYHGRSWEVRLGDRSTLLSGTYFPGNDRHKGFNSIVTDFRNYLSLRCGGAV
jgi:uracil-DNA glycosylase